MCALFSLLLIVYTGYAIDVPHPLGFDGRSPTSLDIHVLLVGALVFAILEVAAKIESSIKKLSK